MELEQTEQQTPTSNLAHHSEWLKTIRPYAISRDVTNLEKKKPVTKILRSDTFRGKLEDVFRNVVDGKTPAIRRLQANIAPASQIEKTIRQRNQPNIVQQSCCANSVIPINDLTSVSTDKYSIEEKRARCKLASLYRVIERMGWSFEIYNHISLRVPGKDKNFLINAFGLHYSEVTASNLVKTDLNGDIIDPGSTQFGINRAGYVIHSGIHEARSDIECIIHLHTPHGAAVSTMLCGLLPLCQEAMIVGGVSYHAYRGIVCNESEKAEIVQDLGPINKAMILHNHGLLAMGSTVEEAYHICMNLMAACETQVFALSAGFNNVMLVDNLVAKKVYKTVNNAGGGVTRHKRLNIGELEYEAMMRVLDNLGYNTGYPYNFMDILAPNEEQERQITNTNKAQAFSTGTAQSNDDIDTLIKKIKQQVHRIRREKQQKQHLPVPMAAEKDSNIEKHSISPSHVNLEFIAKHSSGTTHPISTGITPFNDPHVMSMQPSVKPSQFPAAGLNNPLVQRQSGERSNCIVSQNGASLDNSQGLVDVYGNLIGTSDPKQLRKENREGVWDFLDERQSQGLLPISKENFAKPPSHEMHSEQGLNLLSQTISHPPLASVQHSLLHDTHTVRNHNDKSRHVTLVEDNQSFENASLPNTITANNQPPLNEHISSQTEPHSDNIVTLPQKHRRNEKYAGSQPTTLNEGQIHYHEAPNSSNTVPNSTDSHVIHPADWSYLPSSQTNQHLLSGPSNNLKPHFQTESRGQSSPCNHFEQSTEARTSTWSKPSAQTGQHPQLQSAYILPSQVGANCDSFHNPKYDNNSHSDSSFTNSSSNPSVTYLITQKASNGTHIPVQSGAFIHNNEQPLREPSPQPSMNAYTDDLDVRLDVEKTARAVANSTGESVERLSHHRYQQKKRNNEVTETQSTQNLLPTADSNNSAKQHDVTLGNHVIVTKSTVKNISTTVLSLSNEPVYTPQMTDIPPSQIQSLSQPHHVHPSILQAEPSESTPSSPLYIYSPPLIDKSLIGLEKALDTTKKVAESTEISVVKLRKSQNSVSNQKDNDNNNDPLDNDDSV